MSLKDLFKGLFAKPVYIPASGISLPEPRAGERQLPEDGFMGQVKLGVIVGHSKEAQGARMCEPFGLYEYSYNMEVAKYMKEIAPQGLLVEIILRDGKPGEIVRSYNEAREKLCDAVIELHFNAFNGRARGSETLCSPDASDVEFTNVIHRAVATLFGREQGGDRGVKTLSKSARGGINVHSFPGGVNCLVEPFFGDNVEDAKLGMDKRSLLAKCLVNATVLWAKKVDLLK